MAPILAGPHAARRTCPRCGAGVRGDVTELATFFSCGGCGTDWVEDLALDFTTD